MKDYFHRNNIHFFLLLLALPAMLCQCGFLRSEAIKYHSLYYPSPLKYDRNLKAGVIMVYRFLMIPSDQTYGLVVSGSDDEADVNEYQKWKDKPADMITDLIRRDLVSSGIFIKAVDQSSNIRYRYALEGQIHELKAKVGESGPMAHFTVDVTLIDFDAPVDMDRNILKKKYSITKKCDTEKAQSLVKGLNQAVREFSERLRKDIRSALAIETKDPDKGRAPGRKVRKAHYKGTIHSPGLLTGSESDLPSSAIRPLLAIASIFFEQYPRA
jgi:ABC-type uncharacterized transport system auxiliary subunit